MFTFFVLALVSAPANAGISGTAHDFSTATGPVAGPTNEICVYCHTPHNASSAIQAPLWNHDANLATTYTMYNNTVSATIDMTVQAQVEGISLACLACHDGVMAISDYVNGADPDDQSLTFAGDFPGSTALLGTVLSDDHPISVVYDPAVDTAFQTVASVTGAGLPLYIGTGVNQVECGSCHNVHDDTFSPFLRLANTGSALCLTCHIK